MEPRLIIEEFLRTHEKRSDGGYRCLKEGCKMHDRPVIGTTDEKRLKRERKEDSAWHQWQSEARNLSGDTKPR